MALRLRGSESGYAEIDAPAVAGDVTLTLPSTTGTINVKDASGNTEVGTGVTFGNPSANIFTIDTNGSERLRIAADGTVSIPGALNVSGVLTYEDVTSVDAIGLSTFRDGLNTKDVGLNAISSTDINDDTVNAVDVFIYDTSKDSDGGEWRKRTSHTSWYNETLNTSTRGSRREFPAVAVIVVTSTFITIYDGDDPDLPMWMKFTIDASPGMSGTYMLQNTGFNHTVAMLNGILVEGYADEGSNYGSPIINFISEKVVRMDGQASGSEGGIWLGNIADRNSTKGYAVSSEDYEIVNGAINDIAMTVLPNAPIDDATGLPIPTIAVATDGGVSVIKDDGTVVDFTPTYAVNNQYGLIDFLKDNRIISTSRDKTYPTVFSIPSSDTSSFTSNDIIFSPNTTDSSSGADIHGKNFTPFTDITNYGENIAMGGNGLRIANIDEVSGDDTALVADIRSDYNTGWMQGDIKGAFLSGISTASVTGTDLVTNGDFSNGTTGWTASNAVITVTSGVLKVDDSANAGGDSQAYRTVTGLTIGKVYNVGVRHQSSSQHRLWIGTGSGPLGGGDANVVSAVYTAGSASSPTSHYYTFTASSASVTVALQVDGTGIAYYEWVYINESVEEDRSVNNNPLQVIGTIDKDPVAGTGDTAAELVAYSGFSASNYLFQPHNSDLDFGTGDFCFSIWCNLNTTSGTSSLFSYIDSSTSTPEIVARISNGGALDYYITDDDYTTFDTISYTHSFTAGTWNFVNAVRRGNTMLLYLNGEEVSSGSIVNATGNLQNTGAQLYVGHRGYRTLASGNNDEQFFRGNLALFRVSRSAPSPEQIKKIYEDEKHLFQENAACTLYGSSDAVTALAYDEITDQLHVGTSSGRSNFQGLRRINNTTQGVETAISAHDSFIIEQ